MKVKLVKENILLEGSQAKVVIADKLDSVNTEGDIIISPDRSDINAKGKYLINNPGEYELKDVFVYAIADKDNKKIELFSIDLDGINFVYLASNAQVPSKKVLAQLSINNVLLLRILDSKLEVMDLINALEPEIIVPITDNKEDLSLLAKNLSVTLPEAQSSLTLNPNNFNSEEEHSFSLVTLK